MTRRKTRMKLPIPDDWSPDSGNWNIAMFCYPDSKKWRGIIHGAFYELTRGRKWDESTGTIRTTQAIARDIMESLSMNCNSELSRIADAIEALNPDSQKISLDDLINGVANDPLGTFTKIKPILDTMKSLQDLLPGFQTKIDPVELAGLLVDAVAAYNANRHSTEMVHLAQLQLMLEHGADFGLLADTVLNLLPGGTIADAMTDTDEYIMLTIDTIIQALVGTSTVAALIRIGDKIEAQDLSGLGDIAAIATQITEVRNSLDKLDELTTVSDKIELVHQVLTQIAAIDTQDELTAIAAKLDELTAMSTTLTAIAANDTQDELTAIADKLDTINMALTPLGNLSQLQYLDNIERAIRQSSCCPNSATEYVPENWTDETTFLDYKCRAANAIYEAIEQLIYAWKMDDWNQLLQAGLTATVSMLASLGISALAAVGLGVAFSEMIVPAIGLFVVFLVFGEVTFSPDDVYSSITNNKQAIINALYNAQNTDEAEAGFVENLTLITDVEKLAVKTLLTKDILSTLFNDSVPSDYTPADPVTCGNDSISSPIDMCGSYSLTSYIMYGTPKSLLSGDIINSGTLTSEVHGVLNNYIMFKSRQRHRITITAVSGSIVDGNFTSQDCVNNSIVEHTVSLDSLPVTVEGYGFYSSLEQDPFTITFTAEAI